jgi:hypothetical protein
LLTACQKASALSLTIEARPAVAIFVLFIYVSLGSVLHRLVTTDVLTHGTVVPADSSFNQAYYFPVPSCEDLVLFTRAEFSRIITPRRESLPPQESSIWLMGPSIVGQKPSFLLGLLYARQRPTNSLSPSTITFSNILELFSMVTPASSHRYVYWSMVYQNVQLF